MRTLKIAVCQMTSVDDVEKNFQQIEQAVLGLKQAQIAFFPENCLYMRIQEGQRISGFTLQDDIFKRLSSLTLKTKIALHLGSVPLKETLNGQEKLTNATIFVSESGQVSCTYRKMHLFDIELEGQKPIRESDVFHHGGEPQVLNFHQVKIGQTICYDLRFAELFSKYAQQHVELIVVPSAFLVPTGKAHWEVLLRARAIESQTFVVAAAQAGVHKSDHGQRSTYGHSMIVSPWGEILAKANGSNPQTLEMTLDLEQVEKVRRQIPMKSHRRL